jgi:carbon-monoxide dehydrogenase large subunit
MYRIPKVDVGVACYFSNTIPIGPYRGAGRPEANYALERVVEEAARITGIDSVLASQEEPHSAFRHAVQDANPDL